MTRILSVREAARARLKECVDVIAEQFLPTVRTVYHADESTFPRPEAIGSCFLLNVDGRRFVVTAAHVVDFGKQSRLYIAGHDALVDVSGTFSATRPPAGKGRKDDRYDFAFGKLSPESIEKLGAVEYIDAARQVSENRGTMQGRTFMVMGYPSSRNKVNKIDPARTHVRAKVWTYSATAYTDDAVAKAVGVDYSTHLLVKHHRKFSRTFSGELARSVRPQGASGGALLDLGVLHPSNLASDVECSGRLAGVLIEKNMSSHAIVAVKIGLVLDALRREFE